MGYQYGNFSRMRSKGSRFTLGVWGLRVCSLDVAFTVATVRNRSQPSATVRNRSRDPRMAVPMGSFAEVVLFGGFRRVVASFRVAGVVVLCGRRNTFVTFSEDVLQFSWQAQHFGRVHRHFSWQAQHFRRVVLRVFVNRIGRAASSGDKVQIPWQAWHFVRCAEN